MALVKFSDLSGACLDWAVAQCEARSEKEKEENFNLPCLVSHFKPSSDWSQGGPIIEREKLSFSAWLRPAWEELEGPWIWACAPATGADLETTSRNGYGNVPLLAAMRSYVGSKMGDEIEIPDDLL